MNPTKIEQLAFILLASLILSGCGGGGGGSAPPAPPPVTNSPPPNTSLQLWAPYFTITGTTSGSTTTYTDGNLSVDSILNPYNHQPLSIQSLDALNPLTNIQNIDSSGILTASGSGYTLNGARYFFFSNNGKLYSLDLTSQTVPVPTQLGTLTGLTEVCGIQAEQSDGTGLNGEIVVSGATSGTSPSDCTSPQTWIVPFNTLPNAPIAPLGFHEFLVTTFLNTSNNTITTVGYVTSTITVSGSNTTYSINLTNDLTQPGTSLPISYDPNTGDSLASDRGGDTTHQFVWVNNASASTNSLYIVNQTGSNTGTASPVSLPSSNISKNTAADDNGNLYVTAILGSSGSYTLDVCKVSLNGQSTVIYSVPANATTFSTNITVNPAGTGGMLTLTEPTNTTNPVQNFVFPITNTVSTAITTIPSLATSNTYQFIGFDGSGILNAQDAHNLAQNDLYAVNLVTGAIVKQLPNQYLVSPIWGSNFISAANPYYESYGSLLAATYLPGTQTLSGAASVIETRNYTTTAGFSLPPGTTSFVPAYISTSPHYIMGMSSGSAYNLFAVVPSTNLSAPGTPVSLGTNSSTSSTTTNWNGY